MILTLLSFALVIFSAYCLNYMILQKQIDEHTLFAVIALSGGMSLQHLAHFAVLYKNSPTLWSER